MSASPMVDGQSHWKEYKNADGRLYWSHALTKQSVWEKPDELKTPFERAVAKTPWKQYTSKGKPYYVNSETKETVWNLPPDLAELKAKIEEEEQRKASGAASPTPSAASSRSESNALIRRQSRSPSPEVVAPVETVTIPPGGFTTHEKAEEAFIYLLKREGIDEHATWDTTMRRIVQDPLWRALESLAKKKAAFEKWQQQIVSDKRAAHETRIAELRPHLTRLFAKSGVIKSYSTMKTATAAFDKDKYWRRAKPEERREILEAYTAELRSHEEKARRALKESNTQSLSRHIRTMEITVATRWRDGHKTILASEQFRADPQLQKMETLDILTVFDDYTRELEKEHDEDARRKTAEYRRRGRKARDGFKVLLRELQEKGDLTQTSKWKDTLPTIRTDERYTALLGLPGSSPLELWMDAVDDLQVNAEERTTKIEEGLKAPVTLETTLADFEAMVPGVDPKEAKEAFEVIHERLTRAAAEAARIEERKRRDRIDDLRYALRKVRQVEAETTYEAALPNMQDLPEFKLLSDEDRHAAFDKHIRRLKEKEDSRHKTDVDDRRDRDHGRGGHRDDYRDRERDRDRDRRDRDRDYRRDRDRDRDRERERDRRDRESRDSHDRESRDSRDDRRRDRDRDTEDRDAKRRRVSSMEREEGEI